MEISVIPVGTQSPSVNQFLVEAVRLAKESGLDYEVDAMGTTISGDPQRLLNLALKMHQQPFKMGANRVDTTIRIDERRDREESIQGQVREVKEQL